MYLYVYACVCCVLYLCMCPIGWLIDAFVDGLVSPGVLVQVRKAAGSNLAHATYLFMTLVLGTVLGLAFAWQIGG